MPGTNLHLQFTTVCDKNRTEAIGPYCVPLYHHSSSLLSQCCCFVPRPQYPFCSIFHFNELHLLYLLQVNDICTKSDGRSIKIRQTIFSNDILARMKINFYTYLKMSKNFTPAPTVDHWSKSKLTFSSKSG